MKDIRITVTDEEYRQLEDAKDGRTWHDAVVEELGHTESKGDLRDALDDSYVTLSTLLEVFLEQEGVIDVEETNEYGQYLLTDWVRLKVGATELEASEMIIIDDADYSIQEEPK